jgi:hypothetical protein
VPERSYVVAPFILTELPRPAGHGSIAGEIDGKGNEVTLHESCQRELLTFVRLAQLSLVVAGQDVLGPGETYDGTSFVLPNACK